MTMRFLLDGSKKVSPDLSAGLGCSALLFNKDSVAQLGYGFLQVLAVCLVRTINDSDSLGFNIYLDVFHALFKGNVALYLLFAVFAMQICREDNRGKSFRILCSITTRGGGSGESRNDGGNQN